MNVGWARLLMRPLMPLLLGLAGAAAGAQAPVQVMVLGTYHFGNPGLDLSNAQADDVLAPRRQAELEAVADALAGFAPTRIAVEMKADAEPRLAVPAYREHLAGRRAGQRNEIDQIAFRLARRLGHADVFGIDAAGSFPFEPLQKWAEANGRGTELKASIAAVGARTHELEALQRERSIGQLLRWLNEPPRIEADHQWYVQALRLGQGAAQPGAELLAAWTARNLQICARLVQLAQPGDRILVVYGSGHSALLRRCVSDMPGWQLVEPGTRLPR